jgi:hypothetical protein
MLHMHAQGIVQHHEPRLIHVNDEWDHVNANLGVKGELRILSTQIIKLRLVSFVKTSSGVWQGNGI